MKRKVSLVLSLALLCMLRTALFAGGNNQSVPAQKGSGKVTMLLGNDGSPAPGNQVLKALEEATKTKIEIIIVPTADHKTKLSAMIAGGTPPDIFANYADHWVAQGDINLIQELKEAGQLVDVGPLLPTLAPNVLKDVDMETLKKSPVNKDGIYLILTGRRGWADQLNLRTDWLKKLNLQMPTDLDSLYRVFYAFTNNDPDGNGKKDTFGLTLNATTHRGFSTIFGAFGIPRDSTIILPNGTVTTWVKHPKFLDAVTYIRRLINDGLVEPDWVTIPQMEMYGKLWNGIAGAIDWECVGPTNNWMPGRYTEKVPPTFGFPIIKGPDGAHGVPAVFPSFVGGYVISKNADVEACLRIANFCKSPEGSDLLFLGVENVMYRWIDRENGKFEYLGEYKDSTTHRAAGGFCYFDLFGPANSAQLRTLNTQSQAGVAQAFAEGLPNTANIIAALKSRIDYGAEMDQIINELYVNILNTNENIKTVYDRYINEWETAGGAEWEKEVNAAWKAQGSRN
jgi:putative aldouronate transport system substrate-binding protein